jgi:hypothetical protein
MRDATPTAAETRLNSVAAAGEHIRTILSGKTDAVESLNGVSLRLVATPTSVPTARRAVDGLHWLG